MTTLISKFNAKISRAVLNVAFCNFALAVAGSAGPVPLPLINSLSKSYGLSLISHKFGGNWLIALQVETSLCVRNTLMLLACSFMAAKH